MKVASSAAFLTCALSIQYTHAQLSLYVPGFDPQPLSVTELGAGSDGRTTWEIQPGQSTPGAEIGFVGTATLVEGPSDAVLSYTIPQFTEGVAESCTFSNGLAICNASADGSTVVATETIQPFPVEGSAGAVTGSPSSTTASASAATTAHPSGGSSPSSGVSATSAVSSLPASGPVNPTQTATNGSKKVSAEGVAVLAAIGIFMVSVCC